MRSCNQDGLLLKPSKPITSIDVQIYAKAFGSVYGPMGEVWSTYSNISGIIFGILFAADIKNKFEINPTNVGFENNVSRLIKFLNYKKKANRKFKGQFCDTKRWQHEYIEI